MVFHSLLILISLVTSLLVGKAMIKVIRQYEFHQFIREEGPQSHKTTKSNTPTGGGLIFLIPTFIFSFLLYSLNKSFQTIDFLIVLFCTSSMFFIGFVDDFLKVQKKENKGISGWTKLAIQLILSVLIFYLYRNSGNILYFFWIFIIFAGSCNSYNLTDGLDGLAAIISIIGLIGIAFLLHNMGKIELVSFSLILIGALLGFLYFNKHPAKIFMGDTGSLALGGAIGSLALVTNSELYLLLFAGVPVLEALSVICQVASCKISKKLTGQDKRILKMAPLHHHFELIGWKETDIVKKFSLFQLVLVIIGICIIYLV